MAFGPGDVKRDREKRLAKLQAEQGEVDPPPSVQGSVPPNNLVNSPPAPEPKRLNVKDPAFIKARAAKAADMRVRNKYNRTRQEINTIILRDFKAKGPVQLGQELGMKTSAVSMWYKRHKNP
jgi:hypothetical protein